MYLNRYTKIVSVFLILCFSLSYCQKKDELVEDNSVVIFLADDANIYSLDEDFNEQISTQNIILKNASVNYKDTINNRKILQAVSLDKLNISQRSLPKSRSVLIDNTEIKLKKLREAITAYELRMKAFRHLKLRDFPLQNSFNYLMNEAKSFVLINYQVFSSISSVNENFLIRFALDLLHAQKFTNYNNKSLGFCVSKFLSVRPPPRLVI